MFTYRFVVVLIFEAAAAHKAELTALQTALEAERATLARTREAQQAAMAEARQV